MPEALALLALANQGDRTPERGAVVSVGKTIAVERFAEIGVVASVLAAERLPPGACCGYDHCAWRLQGFDIASGKTGGYDHNAPWQIRAIYDFTDALGGKVPQTERFEGHVEPVFPGAV